MANVVTLGTMPWSRTDMLSRLEEFVELYAKRPIKNNKGGMQAPQLFLSWFAMKTFQPKVIIESGVWLGQGTWFFEQACPEAELHSIDINLDRIEYRSSRARYYQQDFASIDWNHLPKEDTLLFFDDHQNAYERVKTAKWFGFKHMIFEDNYPLLHGDVYSLKKAFLHAGFTPDLTSQNSSRTFKSLVKRIILSTLSRVMDVPALTKNQVLPNQVDASYLLQNLETYFEFPPIFRVAQTRWKDAWDDEKYPTPAPLLTSVSKTYEQIYFDQAMNYTWMCYAKLK